jgi:hypothetical protein
MKFNLFKKKTTSVIIVKTTKWHNYVFVPLHVNSMVAIAFDDEGSIINVEYLSMTFVEVLLEVLLALKEDPNGYFKVSNI